MIIPNRKYPDLYSVIRWLVLAAVLATGWYLRTQILFATEMIPGKNGAYYPVQVRAFLRSGQLGIPDFPLLFWIQAGMAKIASNFEPLQSAIFHATKISDVFFPVLLAIPVFLFVTSFGKSSAKTVTIAGILSVGIFTVTNPELLEMTGEFQKNSAGLPLFLMFAYFLYRALEHHRIRDYGAALLFFCLTCLIHIGVTALSITFFVITMLVYIVRKGNRRRGLIIAATVAVSLAGCLGVVYVFDPERIMRLLGVTLNLRELLVGSPVAMILGFGHSHGIPFRFNHIIIGNILGLTGIISLLVDRKRLTHASAPILIGGTLTALLFASPFIGGDWSERLGLMAFVPALIPLAYMSVRIRWGWCVTVLLAAIMTLHTAKTFDRIPHETLTVGAYEELDNTVICGNTLVIARHGLEWWAAWAMDVKIANNPEAALEAWDKYDTILYLEETGNGAFTGEKELPGFNEPHGGRPPFMDVSMDMPPGPPPLHDGGMGPPPGGSMRDMHIISTLDARTLSEGEYFRLSVIKDKPLMPDGQIPNMRKPL